MRRVGILIAILSAIGLCACDQSPAPFRQQSVDDTTRLQGEWYVVRAEIAGKPLPASAIFPLRFHINATSVRHNYGPGRTVSYQLGPNSTIDFYSARTEIGIYRIEGDELSICSANPGGTRPTHFTTTPDDRNMLWILKRLPPVIAPHDKDPREMTKSE